MKEGYLNYNPQNKRYCLRISDLWEKEFCCGNRLEVLIDGKWTPTRMEMDWSEREHSQGIWYLVDTGLRGHDLEQLRIRVE